MDLIEIDAASNRGIDEIRQLRDTVQFNPSQLRYRFYIIDECHQLTPRRLECLPEDAGGAAAAREVHPLHDGAGETARYRRVALPAVRFPSHPGRGDDRADAPHLRARRPGRQRRRARRHRAAGDGLDARRAQPSRYARLLRLVRRRDHAGDGAQCARRRLERAGAGGDRRARRERCRRGHRRDQCRDGGGRRAGRAGGADRRGPARAPLCRLRRAARQRDRGRG